ncbi:stalk domain-containing protein [Paenibacillus guangzhouensis]|uniref:stalk domain-containing protein n=1 Tax=Paenibacillus guangzhouensis TaxID=1473112 RepID=UPI00187B1E0A|nr:stalk domain-containing protein [Paenibacillus guangzhouensis]
MKKLSTAIMAYTLALTLPMTALAANAPKTEVIAMHKEYQITVNKNALKMQPKVINNVTMVPARAIFEALNFTIKWDEKKKELHAENGERATDFVIGTDSYIAYSTHSIGMTAPTSLGAAPVAISGFVYVPVELFRIILDNENAVLVKDGKISINAAKVSKETDKKSTQIPNPFVNYNTVEDARKAMGVDFTVPSLLPKNYKQDDISITNDTEMKMVQIVYRNGENKLYYRVSQTSGDISGDYNEYETTKTVSIGELKVTLKGDKGLASIASWEANGFNYCLMADIALSVEEVTTLIENIK